MKKAPLVVLVVAVLAAVASITAARQDSKAGGSYEESFLSTDFAACEQPVPKNPKPTSVSAEQFQKLLHGVWVGNRTLRKGTAEKANYMLMFDLEAREGLAFEERGAGVARNAFARLVPENAAKAPRITYFYCGGKEFGAFQDEFIKVSDDPGVGLAALQQNYRVEADRSSIFKTWSGLREIDFFTRAREQALLNTAFYTVSVVPVERHDTSATSIRWDMVGQYRGSPAKFVHGQPIAGLEGGFFDGVRTVEGSYLVGQEVAILCFCDPTKVDWEKGTPLTNFAYDKVVIGPLPG